MNLRNYSDVSLLTDDQLYRMLLAHLRGKDAVNSKGAFLLHMLENTGNLLMSSLVDFLWSAPPIELSACEGSLATTISALSAAES